MDDKQIIGLFFQREEQAIKEVEMMYGSFCKRIAMNILSNHEDAEECVSDTYFSVWNQIPPTIPDSFKSFLGRITRNISISRFRAMHAKKRFSGMEVMLSELNDCIPSLETVENQVELKHLSDYICDWLDDLREEDQMFFIRRYWFGDSVQNLAIKCGITPAQMAQRMLRLRKSLKSDLEQKGVVL